MKPSGAGSKDAGLKSGLPVTRVNANDDEMDPAEHAANKFLRRRTGAPIAFLTGRPNLVTMAFAAAGPAIHDTRHRLRTERRSGAASRPSGSPFMSAMGSKNNAPGRAARKPRALPGDVYITCVHCNTLTDEDFSA